MFDGPAISLQRTNEENIQILKGYLNDMADKLNYLQNQVEDLAEQVKALKEG